MQDRDFHFFRIPESLNGEYRRWPGSRYTGWVETALFAAMSPDQQSDPGRLFQREGAQVVRHRRNLTMRVDIGRRAVWLKRFRPTGPVDRLVYAVRPGKAVYAWNAAMALIESGFATPRPLIGLRPAGRLGGARGMVGFEDVGAHRPLRAVLGDPSVEAAYRERVLKDLGTCLRRFHDLGFRHRDLRQGNILAAAADGGWSFWFLDLNRLRVQAPLTRLQRLREVEKLDLDAAGLEPFFGTYMPERDSREMARLYRRRVDYANRLEHLPLGKLARKAWYYWWELRAFSRAHRP